MSLKRLALALLLTLTLALPLAACAPAAPKPADVVARYYAALNAQELDQAMAFIAPDAVFVNPYGRFAGTEAVRASLQLVMNDGITFDLSNFRDTNGRVTYDYTVKVGGEAVESGTDGLTVVQNGKITLDATEALEWLAYVNTAAFTAETGGFSGPASVPAGWTELSLTNASDGIHHLQLVKLVDGKTAADLLAALQADGENWPSWAVPAGGPNAPDPGATTTAVVNLEEGNYAVLSVIPNGEGVPGFLNGMLTTLTVTAAQATTQAPPADLTIDLTEFALGIGGSVPAGPHVLAIRNQGTQVHEAYLVKLNDGATVDDYLNTPPDAAPPAVGIGGITGIAPGAVNYAGVWLEAGHYALFCFFPDPASHAPHFALGMVAEFTVP